MRQSASSQMPLPRMFNCMLLQLQTVIRFIWRVHCAWVRSLQWLQWKMRLGFFHNRNKRRVWFTHSVLTIDGCEQKATAIYCHGLWMKSWWAAAMAQVVLQRLRIFSRPSLTMRSGWQAAARSIACPDLQQSISAYLSCYHRKMSEDPLDESWPWCLWELLDARLGGIIRGPQHWPSTN